MKCPYCGKEIKDDAVFCGFCGKQVLQIPIEEASQSPQPDEVKNEVPEKTDNVPAGKVEKTQKKKNKDKPKKKHTAVKVLLIFVLLSFISGSVLGFLTARGIVSLESLIPNSNFKWTSFSEGQSEKAETEDTLENKENEEKESSETSSPADEEAETSPSTETADSSSDTSSTEESQQPTENDAHYAKHVGDSLVVIDDKAHIWEGSTIDNIMANARAMSELSGYSIVIVVTNDMFDMTSREFAENYYDYVLTSNEDEAELIADGYIFLINLADSEYYLSACGEAIGVYTDTVMNELFGEIQQFMADGDYETAVNKVIEKTVY